MGVDPKAVLESLDAMKARIAALDSVEQRTAALEAFRAQIAEQMRKQSMSLPGVESYRDPKTGEGYSMRKVALAVLLNRNNGTPFDQVAPFEWGVSEEVRKGMTGAPETRIMSTLSDTGGGFLVPSEVSKQMVEYLFNEGTARKLGITTIQPTGFPFIVNKETASVTAYMTGENASAVSATDIGFGQVNLMPKKMTARTVITQELLKFGGPSVEAIINRHFAQAFAEKEDQQIFNGTGSEYQLRGITSNASVNSVNTGSTSALRVGDVANALFAIEEDKVKIDKAGLALHTKVKNSMKKQLLVQYSGQTEATGAGFLFGLPMLTDAKLRELIGYPIESSTVHSVTLSGDGDETWPILGVWSNYWLAEFGGMLITASDVATDGTHNAWTEDKKHLKITRWLDGGVMRDEAFCLLKTIVYGSL